MPKPVLKPLPFKEAIEAMRKRGVVLPETYYDELQGLARAQAFSIAGLSSLDQLQGVLDTLTESLEKGESFRGWQKKVQNGDIPLDLPRHRLDNIFRTNIQGAYNRGRCEQQQRNRKRRPYLMYDSVNDSRTRPAHARMDGHIAPADDPIWNRWYPPNGYRCRCRIISLTKSQAQARGIATTTPNTQPDKGWDHAPCTDPNTGILKAMGRKLEGLHQILVPVLKGLWAKLVGWNLLPEQISHPTE